jgi:putative ABC transport system ATP-binding protein
MTAMTAQTFFAGAGGGAPPSSDTVIATERLTRVYDLGEVKVPALRGVDVAVRAGELVAIMGASGSGKSTFMNILGGLDRPTGGTYRLSGIDVSSLSGDELARVRNRYIGFVFQGFNLLARTSALENVELPLLYAGLPSRARVKRAREVLARVGLADREDHLPTQLSGGQQQRVAIARALANHPRVILAGEPTGNLDSQTSAEIMALFQELNAQGSTIVLVTHEAEIAALARRVITFRDGRILDDGPVGPAGAAHGRARGGA